MLAGAGCSAGLATCSVSVSGSGSATATFPPASGFIGTTLDFEFCGFFGRPMAEILPLSRGFRWYSVGPLTYGCKLYYSIPQ